MYDLNHEIGKRISQLRKTRHITQETLAEDLDVSVKHISAVERGMSSFSMEKLIEVSKIFDCSLDFLILGKDNANDMIPASLMEILSDGNSKDKTRLLKYMNFYTELMK